MQMHGLLKLGTAPATGVQRHIQQQTDHLLALCVAGRTIVTRTTDAVARSLCHQIESGRSHGEVFFNVLLRRIRLRLL